MKKTLRGEPENSRVDPRTLSEGCPVHGPQSKGGVWVGYFVSISLKILYVYTNIVTGGTSEAPRRGQDDLPHTQGTGPWIGQE